MRCSPRPAARDVARASIPPRPVLLAAASPPAKEVMMADHDSISPEEAADRLAIRELVDAYAFCADTRDAEGQKALFTDDTHFVGYLAGGGSDATDDVRGRESLTPVFDNLNAYEVTMHFNGQSTVALDGERATGETYCLAHHVYSDDGDRKLMIAAIRYQDTCVRTGETWRFAE